MEPEVNVPYGSEPMGTFTSGSYVWFLLLATLKKHPKTDALYGDNGIRTHDPLTASQVRSHCAISPKSLIVQKTLYNETREYAMVNLQ